MLVSALAGAGVIVVLAAVGFVVFGRDSDQTQAAYGTPQARDAGRQTARPTAGRGQGPGHGSAQDRQEQRKKKQETLSKKGKRKPSAKPSGKRTPGPTRKPAQPPAPKPNKYSPQQACGSGYRVLASHPLYLSGARVATVYLLYSDANGNNCAVTMRSDQTVGKTEHGVRATLQAKGGKQQTDGGAYLWYAGPVRVHAPGKCVRFAGTFTTGTTAHWSSAYGHCG